MRLVKKVTGQAGPIFALMVGLKINANVMLKNIRLHLEKDEEKQALLEEKLGSKILATHNNNINSFARNIPSLLPLVQSPKLQNHALFCNKFGEINVVDYGVGRTLYNFHPEQEVSEQLARFNKHAPYIKIKTSKQSVPSEQQEDCSQSFQKLDSFARLQSYSPCPNDIECLVVLGCGLGLHILELVKSKSIKYLIVYEPEVQYFQCSALVTKWNEIFDLAKKNGTQIFLQVEKDGRDLLSDIRELNANIGISGFYLYKHYNHTIFNALELELASKPWPQLVASGITFKFHEDHNQYTPTWTPSINLPSYSNCEPDSDLYQSNLKALEKYFPDIHSEFKNYSPNIWLPIKSADGQINIIKKDSLTPWYSDQPKQDCLHNYENYNEQPHKDGLVLGYKGTKLAHYLHYQFVKETEELLKEAEEELGALPEHIASIIMFGLGVGYQLETLLEKHSIEKLFICEPNRDFFYASLFAIDWQHIFDTVDKTDARLYMNIGDDGTHLFRDLLNQFHSIGPYILSNTYFYQSYYNASLNTAIAQLREQLQVVISMGEYFDHAYYGIEHTKEGFRRNIPVLTKDPSKKLSYDDKEVPVFVVGNGPSLDLSIEAIKEWKDQAIVISCGTALQALHRHGITPDFHAEIEQNRSTFDWAVLVGDLDYLKKITLISCNGIHPDTCDLYKDVLIAFKEGESSTVSSLSVLGQENFEKLQHAFPTVSNFVTNLVSLIGFNHIYLMGVDLGFIDVKHHHSKSSGYYQEGGEETFDYAEKNNTSLVVPGNFRPRVNTKHEFKISREIIEQVTRQKDKLQTFYNCSDGAKIQGTTPLVLDHLLIMSTTEQKIRTLQHIKSSVFSTLQSSNFIERYEKKFSHSILIKELTAIEQLVDSEVSTTKQANYLINKQKEMLFASYKNGGSLLFYYLYGTMNYANAVMSKMLNTDQNPANISDNFKRAKDSWYKTLQTIKLAVVPSEFRSFDISYFNFVRLNEQLWKSKCKDRTLTILTDCVKFKKSVEHLISTRFPFLTLKTEKGFTTPEYIVSYFINPNKYLEYLNCKGTRGTISVKELSSLNELTKYNSQDDITLMPFLFGRYKTANCEYYMANTAIRALMDEHKCDVILPKQTVQNELAINTFAPLNYSDDVLKIEYPNYITLYASPEKPINIVGQGGARGKILVDSLTHQDLIFKRLNSKEMEKTRNILANFVS